MKTYHVVCAIIERDGRVLATQRGYGDYRDGWEFPGGKIEQGETPEEAVVREISEELKVRVSVERHVCDVSWDYPTFHLEMAAYLARIEEGEVELIEHEAARWVDGTDIDQVGWLPADVLVVSALKEQHIV